MSNRTLTQKEARSLLLNNQGLIRPLAGPTEVLSRLVAVQTQYAQSLEVAISARCNSKLIGWENQALAEGGEVIKSWSLRNTLHAHLPEAYHLIRSHLGGPAHARWRKHLVEKAGILNFDDLLDQAHSALQKGPLSRKELHALVPELAQVPFAGWGGDVASLAFQGKLRFIGRGAAQKFAADEPVMVDDALPALFLRYIRAFGPATFDDFIYWTGSRKTGVKALIQQAISQVEEVFIEGYDKVFYLHPDSEPATKPCPVRFLAKFDPLAMGHKDKTLWLDSKHAPHVFRKAGQVEAVVLIDGRAVGTWRLKKQAQSTIFAIEPFQELSKQKVASLEREANKMVKQIGWKNSRLEISDCVAFE